MAEKPPRFTDKNLFGPQGPNVNDIKQDAFGDCYFVATLAAVARQNPALIRNAIDYNARGYNFMVRLYTKEGKKKSLFITQAEIANNVARRGGSYVDNTAKDERIWPAVMETAYAKLYDSNAKDGLDEGYKKIINGGYPADAMMAITGSTGTEEQFHYYSRLAQTGSLAVLGNRIATALNNNKAVTLWSVKEKDMRNRIEKLFKKDIQKDGLVNNHVYTVTQSKQDAAKEWQITMRNPWGTNLGVGEGKDNASAFITVPLRVLVETGGMRSFQISN